MAEFGPVLPPSLIQNREGEEKDDSSRMGPRIGSTTTESSSGKAVDTFGPILPPGLKSSTPTDYQSRSEIIGPALPAHLDGSAEDEEVIIGPLPPSAGEQKVVILVFCFEKLLLSGNPTCWVMLLSMQISFLVPLACCHAAVGTKTVTKG